MLAPLRLSRCMLFREREREREKDRQTDRHTDRQTDRQTDREPERRCMLLSSVLVRLLV
jgi:hypothetical protein